MVENQQAHSDVPQSFDQYVWQLIAMGATATQLVSFRRKVDKLVRTTPDETVRNIWAKAKEEIFENE